MRAFRHIPGCPAGRPTASRATVSLSGLLRDTTNAGASGRARASKATVTGASPVGRTDSPSPGACPYSALARDWVASPGGACGGY